MGYKSEIFVYIWLILIFVMVSVEIYKKFKKRWNSFLHNFCLFLNMNNFFLKYYPIILAFLSFLFSVFLWFSGDKLSGIFVGIWVPSILTLSIAIRQRRRDDKDLGNGWYNNFHSRFCHILPLFNWLFSGHLYSE